MGTGILTTVLFCLPPLLQIRTVRPNLVLRRMVEEPASQQSLVGAPARSKGAMDHGRLSSSLGWAPLLRRFLIRLR